jgi:hypothetical protein
MAKRPPAVWNAPQKSPVATPKKINISRLSWTLAVKHYHDAEKFREEIKEKFGGMHELDWNKAKPTNTCALRVSYALYKIGVDMNGVAQNQMLTKKGSVGLPSVAADYANILDGGTELKKSMRLALNHRRGIILFKGGMEDASGHVTFFRDINCHDLRDNKYFENEGTTIWYWIMQQ